MDDADFYGNYDWIAVCGGGYCLILVFVII